MLHLNYDEASVTIICKRKHVLMDSTYYVYVLDDWLILCDTPKQQNPKYKIALNLQNKVHWQVKVKTPIIEQFGFVYKGKVKYFHGTSSDLLKLKDALRRKIMFKDISDFYQPVSLLGRGGSSKVYLILKKGTQEYFASKCVDKHYLQEDGGYNALFNEIQLMQKMKHNKVINLEELYEGDNTFYMLLEYLQGQSLHDMMNKRQSLFDQEQIQMIVQQILTAVAYMHSLGIMHRDLKPENLMFKEPNNIEQLKLVDFGLATTINSDVYPFPKCGTPGYVAPEIANLRDQNQKYDLICDMFSVGCIFFKLCTGKDLFPGTDYHEILRLNKRCVINLETLAMYRTPPEGIQLMQEMLRVNPKERITAVQALQHPYFQKKYETKKSKFQQYQNKQNPVFQTQNFQPNSQPIQMQLKLEDDQVEEENTQKLQVPIMQNIKTFGSFVIKSSQQGPNNGARKNFRKFQTTEFDPYLTPTSPFSNNNNYRPSLVINHQAIIQEEKKQQMNGDIEFMAKIDEQEEEQITQKKE